SFANVGHPRCASLRVCFSYCPQIFCPPVWTAWDVHPVLCRAYRSYTALQVHITGKSFHSSRNDCLLIASPIDHGTSLAHTDLESCSILQLFTQIRCKWPRSGKPICVRSAYLCIVIVVLIDRLLGFLLCHTFDTGPQSEP